MSFSPEPVTIFVPGPLRNPLNGSRGVWQKHARWARQWRERAGTAFLVERQRRFGKWPWPPEAPKRITFLAQTWATWDDDALRAGLKPIRDAVRDARIVVDDAPKWGHEWVYAQVINRGHRGVMITIEVLPSPDSSPLV